MKRIETKPEREWAIRMFMTDQWSYSMKAVVKETNTMIAKVVQARGDPPLVAMNKGWCLGCKQRGGECQCAELGTDPEWVEEIWLLPGDIPNRRR